MPLPTPEQIAELFRIDREFAKPERERRGIDFDDTRSWIDPNGHRLSDRVWDARQSVRSQIDAVLRTAIATGEDALVTAKKLEQFMNPSPRNAIKTTAPGRGGMGNFAARRLARTEISRAHAQATEWSAARTPFVVGLKWNVSGNHPRADECDGLSRADNGLGPGVYRVGQTPRMPAHPMCRCYWTTETEQDDEKIVADLRRRYRLDEI